MSHKFITVFGVYIFLGLSAGGLAAAEPASSGEARLRDALRDATLQLRSVQSELAALQASQAALADEKKALVEKYETLRKTAASEHASTDQAVATMKVQLVEQKSQITKLKDELDKSRVENQKNSEALKVAETEKAKISTEKNVLERKVADRETKNLALFVIGNQILAKYEDYSLGKALSAKEPFVGKTRVRLENLMQDYEDKLDDQRIKR